MWTNCVDSASPPKLKRFRFSGSASTSKAGFRPVARIPFNPAYTEDPWLLEQCPDVYAMMRTEKSTEEVIRDIRDGNYKQWTQDELDALPTFDDYDEALFYRDRLLEEV